MVLTIIQCPGRDLLWRAVSADRLGVGGSSRSWASLNPARDTHSSAVVSGGAHRGLSEVITMTGGEIAAIITAIVGALIGISGIFISAATSRRAAKKDEVD